MIASIVVEYDGRRLLRFGAQLFSLDCILSDYWIRQTDTAPHLPDLPDFPAEELMPRFGEFLADHRQSEPLIIASTIHWKPFLVFEPYIVVRDHWMEVSYSAPNDLEAHLDKIHDEVYEGRYKWTKR